MKLTSLIAETTSSDDTGLTEKSIELDHFHQLPLSISCCWWLITCWPTLIQRCRTGRGQRVELVAPCSEPWCSLSAPVAKQRMTMRLKIRSYQICCRSLWTYCITHHLLTLNICPHHHCIMEFFPPLLLCPAPLPLLLQRALQSCNMSLQVWAGRAERWLRGNSLIKIKCEELSIEASALH